MDSYNDVASLWDLSNLSSFSPVADDDFIAMLQKQMAPTSQLGAPLHQSINPQSTTRYSLSPPSLDSSPSPPTHSQDHLMHSDDIGGDGMARAGEGDSDEIASHKALHTQASQNRKASSAAGSRRKSAAATTTVKDESRLLKRKEQNRAAQRAFRERKEKHVKDLEDKVAALEAKNEQAVSENENLRDLLQRLQSENVVLKQVSLSHSLSKPQSAATDKSSPGAFQTPETPSLSAASQPSTTISSPVVDKHTANPLDWSSLTSFDPSVLNLLDDQPQPTATTSASMMDFGFAPQTAFTTIANNPMLMSYASLFDSATPTGSDTNSLNFDLNSLSPWPSPPNTGQDPTSLDDIFSSYLGQAPYSFNMAPDVSPVAHHTVPQALTGAARSPDSIMAMSSSSSPESSASEAMLQTPVDSSMEHKECPKSKEEFAAAIHTDGASPFAPSTAQLIRKVSDSANGQLVPCSNTVFPKIEMSDKNVEVLSAWKSITSHYKDADIHQLCSEFSSKARCDGTKLVLEPSGVHTILEKLSRQ